MRESTSGAGTSPKRRISNWLWVVIGIVAIGVLVILAPIVALVALVVMITAIVSLSNGKRTWLGIASRKVAGVVTVVSAVVFVASGSIAAAQYARDSDPPTASSLLRSEAPRPSVSSEPDDAKETEKQPMLTVPTAEPEPVAEPELTPEPEPTTESAPETSPQPVPFAQVSTSPSPVPEPPAPEPSVAVTESPAPAPTAEAPVAPAPTHPVKYKNCDDVRAHGAAPLYRGEPGYESKLDRDGDGVACEK